MRRLLSSSILALGLSAAASAGAGSFGPTGDYRLDPGATASIGFETAPDRYVPADADPMCLDPLYKVVEAPDAVEGSHLVQLAVPYGCAERFRFSLPAGKGSYRATMWMRHGGLDAAVVVLPEEGSGLETINAVLTPTGRTTSDGWVELASNPFPVDSETTAATYIKVFNYLGKVPTEIDALEVTPAGEYWETSDCQGISDPVCGPEAQCVWGRCALGRLTLPILPNDAIRNDVIDVLKGQIRLFYGGKRSRELYLPETLARLESMRSAKTAFEFWSRWDAAIHALHDWHTSAGASIADLITPKTRLNACFIEGDADLSHDVWPKDPHFADILVSHSGADSVGLKAGDRLIAVDGQHPIAWALSLKDRDFGFHIATDPSIYADLVEGLGGSTRSGGALILQYARELTVLRCTNGVCNGKPETLEVATLLDQGEGPTVGCDNRPSYHLDPAGGAEVPDPTTHRLRGQVFRGPITGTTPGEAIFGMTWDELWGGSPTTGVNPAINAAISAWKTGARGVILDHRAGNGGTLDAASNMTRLARPKDIAAVMRSPMELASFDGPASIDEGVAIFNASKDGIPYEVGASDWVQGLPVALILHRDGSASDYMPYGMKGAPHVRIFGPHATAGAFSTFIELSGWGFYTRLASGDTIGKDGSGLIGWGVEPDVTLLPKQSDLVVGKDTLFEAALAWVRQELKP